MTPTPNDLLRCPTCHGTWWNGPSRFNVRGEMVLHQGRHFACVRCGTVVRYEHEPVKIEQDIPGAWKNGL